MLSLAAGCAALLVAAAVAAELTLSPKLAQTKSRLDRVLPEIRNALASRPGHPTLHVFDPAYSDHGISAPLLLILAEAKPSTPLFWSVCFADWYSLALPPAFRDQWGLLAQHPPDVVVLIDVKEGGVNVVGPSFSREVYEFLEHHDYHARKIAEDVVIAERTVATPAADIGSPVHQLRSRSDAAQ